MTRKEKILIVVTVVLVLVMIGGFIFDMNKFVLARTNLYDFGSDENIEVVSMEKYGFLYYRTAYEAKLLVKDGYWDPYVLQLENDYSASGEFMDYEEYSEYAETALANVSVKPNPAELAIIWLFGSTIKEDSNANVVYIIDQEDDGYAYIYVYYSAR